MAYINTMVVISCWGCAQKVKSESQDVNKSKSEIQSLGRIKCNKTVIRIPTSSLSPVSWAATSEVKGRMVPVSFVCAQNLLDSAVDLLPVRRTGPEHKQQQEDIKIHF